ncbi:hypothetical protein GCM10023116_43240 [Kistimonas scapharcae]|uniref:Excisionase n=1 Tax=Kistimonas scapharcae TaxID=1036133 RepID=A0ABP8VAI8_9GAMM
MSVTWVLPNKLSELTGYTVKSIENKMEQGVWPQGRIWKKAPDGRRVINKKEYDRWAESQPVI